jgi:hypothetical protein
LNGNGTRGWITTLVSSEAGVLSGLFFIGTFYTMCIERRRNMQKNYDTDDSVNTEKTCNVSYEGGKLHCTDV